MENQKENKALACQEGIFDETCQALRNGRRLVRITSSIGAMPPIVYRILVRARVGKLNKGGSNENENSYKQVEGSQIL